MEVLEFQYGAQLGSLQNSRLAFTLFAEEKQLIARERRTGCRVPILSQVSVELLPFCFGVFYARIGLKVLPRLQGGGPCSSVSDRNQLSSSPDVKSFLSNPGDPFDYTHNKQHAAAHHQLRAVSLAKQVLSLAQSGDVMCMPLAELDDIPQASIPDPYPIARLLVNSLAQNALWTSPNAHLLRFHLTRITRRYITDYIFQHLSESINKNTLELKEDIENLVTLVGSREKNWPESGSVMQLSLLARLVNVTKDTDMWWKAVFLYAPALLEAYISLYPIEPLPHLATVISPPILTLIGKKHLFEQILLLDNVYFCLGSLRCTGYLRKKAVTVLAELLASRDDFTVTYMAVACLEWGIHRGKLEESELRRLGVLVEDLLNASTLSHNFRLCEALANLLVKLSKPDQMNHMLDRGTFQELELDQRVTRLLSLSSEELCVEPPYCNLPPSKLLLGRENELNQARKLLLTRKTVTIIGGRGVGKTALACKLAEQLRNGYYIVWMCDASTEETLNTSLKRLSERLGLESLVSLYPHLNNGKVLLLFDDLNHQLSPEFQVLMGSQTYLILTSTRISPEFAVQLLPLDQSTSLQYLTTATSPHYIDRQEELVPLARELDGLPLALSLAVGLLERMTPREVGELVQFSPETSPERREGDSIIMMLLSKCVELASDPSRALLQIVTLLVPEGLPMTLIAPLFQLLQPDSSLQIAKKELKSLGIVSEPETDYLVAPYLVRMTLGSYTEKALKRSLLDQFVRILVEMFDPEDVAHSLDTAVMQTVKTIKDLDEVTEDMFRLTIRYLLRHMTMTGTFMDIKDVLQLCLIWYEDYFKQSNQAMEYLAMFSRIALLATEYDDSEIYAESALELGQCRDCLYARTLMYMAGAKQGQGKFIQAEEAAIEALDVHHHSHCLSSYHLTELYITLASIHLSKQSYTEAESISRRVLHSTSDPLLQSQLLLLLCNITQGQGKTVEAESMGERCKAVLEMTVGPCHPLLASVYLNLAGLYQNNKRLEDAEKLSLKALAIQEKLYGDSHSLLNPVLASIGSLYTAMGRLPEAEKFIVRRLAIQKNVLGLVHPSQAPTYFQLAGLMHEQGKMQEAEVYAMKALQLQETSLSRNHPQFALSYRLLASISLGLTKYQQAEKFALDALYTHEALYGKQDPQTADYCSLLASIYTAQGRFQDAIDFAKDVVRIRKRSKPDEALITGYVQLAEICVKAERVDQAEKTALKALNLISKTHNSKLEGKITGLLINLCMSQSRFSEAEKYYLKAVELVKSDGKSDPYELAVGYQSLANVCKAQGKQKEAGKYAIKARQLVNS